MAVTFANITVGAGTLLVGSNAEGAATYDVGATQDGVSISWEPDMVDIEIDQFGDAARVILSKVKVMVKTTLAENSLANLALAWSYAGVTEAGDSARVSATLPGMTSATAINMGISSVNPTERKIVTTGSAPAVSGVAKTRTYTCNRAISVASSELKAMRTENVKIPVEFRILPLSSQTGKEYGTIVDA